MTIKPSFILLAALGALAFAQTRLGAAEEDGVALAIVYDTSGSMTHLVKDEKGKMTPKSVIAQRALGAIVRRLQNFTTHAPADAPRRMEAALFCFQNDGAKALVKFGPFDGRNVSAWTNRLPTPSSGTPLGNALRTAGEAVLNSSLSRKHVLVITDGINTVGPDPKDVLPSLQEQARKKQANLSVHFVAFDVKAKLFEPIKKLGATVVSAADEPQLNVQLGYILEKKILLEDEEPPPKPKSN
jgi:hypothetical protein